MDDKTNEPCKYRTGNWAKINDESRGTHNVGNQIKFKTSMVRSNLCDYGNVYIHVKGTITVPHAGIEVAPNNRNKKVMFLKICSIY